MRVLVTGGAGYIGSHTMLELLAADHEPLVVDDFSNSSPAALERVARLSNRKFGHVEASITDGAEMDRICLEFRPEAVVHFAGRKAVGESAEMPLAYYETNVSGTVALLKAMDAAGCGRIVFSSSAAVYGNPEHLPFDEEHPLDPVSPYGRTKRVIEGAIRDWAAAGGGRSALLLRYFNPVGAHGSGEIGEDPKGVPDNLVPFIAQVAVGRRDMLQVFGDDYETHDGTGVRDYIHVSDLAAGHVAALGALDGIDGVEAVNLGTGRGYSVLEVLAAFEKASGRSIPHAVAPRREGDVAALVASTGKARDLLGWEAGLGLDAMCADAWNWQSRNPEGYG